MSWRAFSLGVLVGILITFILLALPGPADARHFDRACPHHVTQGYRARVRYIHCEEERVNPPGTGAYAVAVARCESGLRGNVYQHQAPYWPERFRTYTGPKWPADGELRSGVQSFRTNVLVSLRMARAKGWHDDWACA